MGIISRRSLRELDALRNIECELNYQPYAEGSCLIKCGNTHVICSATIEQQVPFFLRNSGKGWVTAEYSMLPRSTQIRTQRESVKGKIDGRTQEIQRLIGRSLRSVMQLDLLGERQVIIDCDVIRADGGTRTASITGGYIALHLAINHAIKNGIIKYNPIKSQVVAISCGIVNGEPMLDLEYTEDSEAEVDANFIMSEAGNLIEVQITGEKRPFTPAEYQALYELARKGASKLLPMQKKLLNI